MIPMLIDYQRQKNISLSKIEKRKCRFTIEIDDKGKCLNTYENKIDKLLEEKTFLIIPVSGTRGSSIIPLLGGDNYKYVMKQGKENIEFRKFNATICHEIKNENLKAIRKFYWNKDGYQVAFNQIQQLSPKDEDRIMFRIDGDDVTDDINIQNYWNVFFKGYQRKTNFQDGYCIIKGEKSNEIMRKHLYLLMGIQIPLISFNCDSFESYGLKDNQNSAMCYEVVEKYVAAMNHLLKNESTKYIIDRQQGYPILLYWYSHHQGDNIEIDITNLLDMMKSKKQKDKNPEEKELLEAEKLKNTFSSIYEGKLYVTDTAFNYIIIGGKNGSRLIIDSYGQKDFKDIVENLKTWFYHLSDKTNGEIIHPNMFQIFKTIEGDNKIPPKWKTELVKTALFGKKFDFNIIRKIVSNIKKSQKADWLLVRLIKLYFKMEGKMDSTPHKLGRLLALYNSAQFLAVRDPNKSLVDKYFSMCLDTPQKAFVNMAKLHIVHAGKKHSGNIEKQIHEIHEGIQYPEKFNTKEQCEFIVGFYNQQQENFNKPKKEEEN